MIKVLLLTLASFSASDSLRTEVIDGKTYVIHRVESKETLFSISRKYGVALLAVVESNPGADSGLDVGALIKVPYSPNNRTKTSAGTIHRVGQKETLYSIAKQYGVTVDDLKNWNNLSNTGLKLGQELLVKPKSVSATTTTTESAPAPTVTTATSTQAGQTAHTVLAGETLYGIARQYGVSVRDLKEWNSLAAADMNVKPGQMLVVKQGGTETARTTAPTNISSTTTTNTNTVSTPEPITTSAPNRTYIPTPVVESVTGADETRESGMALLMPHTETGRKYLVNHRSAKPGTIIRVINNVTRQEIFARVVANLPASEAPDVLLHLSQAAYDKLGGAGKFSVEVIYFK
jgi:LysM repeat protein